MSLVQILVGLLKLALVFIAVAVIGGIGGLLMRDTKPDRGIRK